MTALLLVDLQNDFMPGGALGVKNAELILPVVNKLLTMPFNLIVATRDWHPANHGSFAKVHHQPVGTVIDLDGVPQILWPEHCVQGSFGAEFHSGWDSSAVDEVFSKGVDPMVDSYSTFFDNEKKRSTGLEEYLIQHKITKIYVAGLATDYCVKYSVIDACMLQFDTYVVANGCRGVNLQPDDSIKALDEMQNAGAHILQFS